MNQRERAAKKRAEETDEARGIRLKRETGLRAGNKAKETDEARAQRRERNALHAKAYRAKVKSDPTAWKGLQQKRKEKYNEAREGKRVRYPGDLSKRIEG